jgi:hypothetical protein
MAPLKQRWIVAPFKTPADQSMDGLAAVHAMPRVTAVDDFRSDFSVRGSPYRQIGIVIDGVATPWLQHTVYGRAISARSRCSGATA